MDIGYIRPRKGLDKTTQSRALEEFGCTHIWVAGEHCDTVTEVADSMRAGDRLVVMGVRLLREPRERLTKLHDMIAHFSAIDVTVYDLATSTEYAGETELMRMGIDILAAPKGPNNGKLGRPRLKYTDSHIAAAEVLWRDIKSYRRNRDAVHAMNDDVHAKETGAATVGAWTERRAFDRFGASGRLTG